MFSFFNPDFVPVLGLRFAGEDDFDCTNVETSNTKECTSTATTSGVIQVILETREAFAGVDLICACFSPTEAPTEPSTEPPTPPVTLTPTSATFTAPPVAEESQNSLVPIVAAIGGVAVVIGAALFIYFRKRGQRPGRGKEEGEKEAVQKVPSSASFQVDGNVYGGSPHQHHTRTPALYDPDVTANTEEEYSHSTPPKVPSPKTPNYGYAHGATPHQHHAPARRDPSARMDSREDNRHNTPPADLSLANTSASGPSVDSTSGPSNKDQCRTVLPENRIAMVEAVPVAEVASDYDGGFSQASALTGRPLDP